MKFPSLLLTFYSYLKKDFLLLYKRKKYLFTFILLPILIAGIFLFALNPGSYNINVGICDFDGSPVSNQALNLDTFNPIFLEKEDCLETLKKGIEAGEFPLGIVIEQGFSSKINELKQPKLSLYYDNTDVSFANLMSWKVDVALNPLKHKIIDQLNGELTNNIKNIRQNANLVIENLPLTGFIEEKAEELDNDLKNVEELETGFIVNPIGVEHKPLYPEQSPKDSSIIFIFPVLALFVTLMLSSTSIIYDKKTKFLTRVKSSSFVLNYLLAKVIFFIFLVLVQFLIIFIIFLISGAGYAFNFWAIVELILAIAVVNSLLGFIIGLISNNEGIAVLFSLIISFPLMLISGLFFPVQALPSIVQKLAMILPLNQQILATKSALLFGQSISSAWLIYGIILFAIALLLMRMNE
jgi:ABC-2 type transport system permease protein